MKLLSIAAIALLFLFHAPLGAQVRLLGKTQATVSITNDPDNQTITTNSSNKIQVNDGGITEPKLSDGAVTSRKILDNTIDSTDFGTGARYYIQTHAASSVTINNTPDGTTIKENASGKLKVSDSLDLSALSTRPERFELESAFESSSLAGFTFGPGASYTFVDDDYLGKKVLKINDVDANVWLKATSSAGWDAMQLDMLVKKNYTGGSWLDCIAMKSVRSKNSNGVFISAYLQRMEKYSDGSQTQFGSDTLWANKWYHFRIIYANNTYQVRIYDYQDNDRLLSKILYEDSAHPDTGSVYLRFVAYRDYYVSDVKIQSIGTIVTGGNFATDTAYVSYLDVDSLSSKTISKIRRNYNPKAVHLSEYDSLALAVAAMNKGDVLIIDKSDTVHKKIRIPFENFTMRGSPGNVIYWNGSDTYMLYTSGLDGSGESGRKIGVNIIGVDFKDLTTSGKTSLLYMNYVERSRIENCNFYSIYYNAIRFYHSPVHIEGNTFEFADSPNPDGSKLLWFEDSDGDCQLIDNIFDTHDHTPTSYGSYAIWAYNFTQLTIIGNMVERIDSLYFSNGQHLVMTGNNMYGNIYLDSLNRLASFSDGNVFTLTLTGNKFLDDINISNTIGINFIANTAEDIVLTNVDSSTFIGNKYENFGSKTTITIDANSEDNKVLFNDHTVTDNGARTVLLMNGFTHSGNNLPFGYGSDFPASGNFIGQPFYKTVGDTLGLWSGSTWKKMKLQ